LKAKRSKSRTNDFIAKINLLLTEVFALPGSRASSRFIGTATIKKIAPRERGKLTTERDCVNHQRYSSFKLPLLP
jgi:hypothetical protein